MQTYYTKVRVLIADDHEMVREGLQVMIKEIKEIEIVGEACNGEELILLTRKFLPDVILADVKMPKCNGIEATRTIKKEFPQIGIIALSSFDEESMIIDMLNAGANGYLLKNAGRQELITAVKAAHRHESYYSTDVNVKLAQMISRGGLYGQTQKQAPATFTKRELEVIEMICDGLSSKQIADRLNLSTRTVERYRDLIMDKMEVKNGPSVVSYAISQGLYSKSKEK